MTKIASKIGLKAKLFWPAESEKGGSWSFLIPPKDATEKLHSRSMTAGDVVTLKIVPAAEEPEPEVCRLVLERPQT
jgi:hypothetical protein